MILCSTAVVREQPTTVSCSSLTLQDLRSRRFLAFGSPLRQAQGVASSGSGTAVLYLLLCFVFALYERKNETQIQFGRRQIARHAAYRVTRVTLRETDHSES